MENKNSEAGKLLSAGHVMGLFGLKDEPPTISEELMNTQVVTPEDIEQWKTTCIEIKEPTTDDATVSTSAIVGAQCNHVVGTCDWYEMPVVLSDFQCDDFKDNWYRFSDSWTAYKYCPICGISVLALVQEFITCIEKAGHKIGCCGYWAVEDCGCQRDDWRPAIVGAPDKRSNDVTIEGEPYRTLPNGNKVSTISTGVMSFEKLTAVVGAPDKGRKGAPFKPIEGPVDPRKPFGDLESNDLFGTYVTRDDREIEVVVEMKVRRPDGIDRRWAGEQMDGGGVELGDAWTLRGGFIDLSPEERERIERDIIKEMQ